MFSTNTKIILTVIFVVLFAGMIFTGLEFGVPTGNEKTEPRFEMIYSVSDEEIGTIDIVNEHLEYSIERCEDVHKRADGKEVVDVVYRVWNNHDKELSQEKVRELLSDFYEFHVTEVVSQSEKDLKKYGFTENSPTVYINKKDETTTAFVLGGLSADEKLRYVKIADDNKIYSMLRAKEKSFLNDLEYYRERRMATLDTYTLLSFSVTNKNERIMGIRYKNVDDKEVVTTDTITYVMTLPFNGAVNIEKFGGLMDVFDEVIAIDIVEDNPKRLTKYGLDNSHSVRVVIQDVEKNRHELIFGNTDDAGNIYTMYVGKDIVFTTEPKMYNAVKDLNPAEFIDKYVNIYDMDDVKNVTVTDVREERKYSLDINHGDGEKYGINGREANPRGFNAIYQGIIDIKLDDMADSKKTDKQILEIEFTFNNGSKKNSKFYEYDSKYYGALTAEGEYGLVHNRVINNLLEILEIFDEKPHLEP